MIHLRLICACLEYIQSIHIQGDRNFEFFQIINIIVLVLYRTGYGGFFLGVGGTWNLNEVKDPNTEMVASGVFVGFIIYTGVSLVSYCFATGDHKK